MINAFLDQLLERPCELLPTPDTAVEFFTLPSDVRELTCTVSVLASSDSICASTTPLLEPLTEAQKVRLFPVCSTALTRPQAQLLPTDKPYTLFLVQVQLDERRYFAARRFSDFRQLHDELREHTLLARPASHSPSRRRCPVPLHTHSKAAAQNVCRQQLYAGVSQAARARLDRLRTRYCQRLLRRRRGATVLPLGFPPQRIR